MCHYLIEFLVVGGAGCILVVAGLLFRKREAKTMLWSPLLILGCVAMLSTGVYLVAADGYYDCKRVLGKCPAAIGGSGYPCTNEGVVCADAPGEEEDRRCTTVPKYWFWESACECKCV